MDGGQYNRSKYFCEAVLPRTVALASCCDMSVTESPFLFIGVLPTPPPNHLELRSSYTHLGFCHALIALVVGQAQIALQNITTTILAPNPTPGGSASGM